VTSTNGVDTAYSQIRPYVTRSLSSGIIRAYFTGSVDNSVATIEQASSLGAATNDTIAAYIAGAQSTLDIAMYNINDQTIVNAINEAYDNGVEIRYIAQGTNANIGFGQMNDGIPIHEREDDQGSGMHNKFVIVDADDTDNCWLLTGSTNFTTEGLVNDFNNVILFQEQSLCAGFKLEFEEMWGSDTNEPDPDNSKFGLEKSYDTPSQYYAGDIAVEAYFSPSDLVNSQIISTISTTNDELDFALLAFTRDDIGDAIVEVNDDFFASARGIIEQTGSESSQFDFLEANGVDVYSHAGIGGQLHHKYCLVDPNDTSSDPIVLTGSHNWSSSANNFNDENIVVVHDARVANMYYQEFIKRWDEFGVSVEQREKFDLELYPNPVSEELTLVPSSTELMKYNIISIDGKIVEQGVVQGWTTIDCSDLNSGVYTLILETGSAKKFVKQ
jgi:phosphatidylserine/phosphatidylglycerophosphate/cardiolipin synthase-like enzyme